MELLDRGCKFDLVDINSILVACMMLEIILNRYVAFLYYVCVQFLD
jgi:hypothetical protein